MAGPIGSDRPLGLECVEDSTTIFVEVTDELPRLRHRVRLRKVSNATEAPCRFRASSCVEDGQHRTGGSVALELLFGTEILAAGLAIRQLASYSRAGTGAKSSILSRASARLRGKVSLTEPGSIHALIIKGIRQARRARHAQFAGHSTEERISKVGDETSSSTMHLG